MAAIRSRISCSAVRVTVAAASRPARRPRQARTSNRLTISATDSAQTNEPWFGTMLTRPERCNSRHASRTAPRLTSKRAASAFSLIRAPGWYSPSRMRRSSSSSRRSAVEMGVSEAIADKLMVFGLVCQQSISPRNSMSAYRYYTTYYLLQPRRLQILQIDKTLGGGQRRLQCAGHAQQLDHLGHARQADLRLPRHHAAIRLVVEGEHRARDVRRCVGGFGQDAGDLVAVLRIAHEAIGIAEGAGEAYHQVLVLRGPVAARGDHVELQHRDHFQRVAELAVAL